MQLRMKWGKEGKESDIEWVGFTRKGRRRRAGEEEEEEEKEEEES